MDLFGPVPTEQHPEPGTVAGCITLDRGGAIRELSAELKRLFGYDLTELKGRPLTALLDSESEAQLSQRFESFLAGIAEESVHLTVVLAVAANHNGGIPVRLSVYRAGSEEDAAFVAVVSLAGSSRVDDLDGGGNRALAARILRDEERWRRGLAKQVHQEFSQEVATAKLNLSLLRDRHPAADPNLQDLLDRVENGLERAATSAQSVCERLYPPELDALGLPPALKALAENLSEACGCDVDFVPSDRRLRVSPDRAIFLYRIVQEAVFNAANHSRARKVTVLDCSESNRVRVQIRDEGTGFSFGEAARPAGGLSRMRVLAWLAGGACAVKSEPGGGTTVIVEVDPEVEESEPPHNPHRR